MKKKIALHKIILLSLVILIGLTNTNYVLASQALNVTTFNENNTQIVNKYKITGLILKIQKEEKSTFVLTTNGLYVITNGKVKRHIFKGEILNTASFQKNSHFVYVSPILQKDDKNNDLYVEVRLNLNDGSKKNTTNYSKYMKNFFRTPESINTFSDLDNNKWFTTYNGGTSKTYSLYRIDASGNMRKVASSEEHYKDAFTAYMNLSHDNENNVYFTYTGGSYTGRRTFIDAQGNSSKVLTTLFKVDKELKKTSFDIYGPVDDYKIGPKGDVWVLSGNKTLLHMSKKGKKLAQISLTDGKAISIDSKGAVYILDDNKIKLVSNYKLSTKITMDSAYRYHKVSLFSGDNLVTYNENSFESIYGSSKEIISSDSAVKYRPHVIKDNIGNITVFSRNIYTQQDVNTKLYRIGSTGISFHDIYMNLGEYNKAIAYDGAIYIPRVDDEKRVITINLLKSDLTVEKFIDLNVDYRTFVGMQMDTKKNLYVLTNQSLYKISPNKKVQQVDITVKKGGYQSIANSIIKDRYNNLYINCIKLGYNTNEHEYRLLKINDILDIKEVKLGSQNTADLTFVTAKNIIAMIKADKVNGNKMYTIDEKGNAIINSSYNGKAYYTPGLVLQLQRIWKASDGTVFHQKLGQLLQVKSKKEVWFADIEQVIEGTDGSIFYTDFFNLHVYDIQLPKIASNTPTRNQSKVPVTTKVTLKLSEPVMIGSEFKNITLTINNTKVAATYTLTNNNIVITPKAKLKAKTKYTVKIPAKAIKDIAGNSLASDYTYTFTTQ